MNEIRIDYILASFDYYFETGREFMVTNFKFLAKNFITTKILPFLVNLLIYKKQENP